MRDGGTMDRSGLMERIEANRRLADQSRTPAIRNLHLRYVRLYRHLLDARTTV
jgi:hypothetical protein